MGGRRAREGPGRWRLTSVHTYVHFLDDRDQGSGIERRVKKQEGRVAQGGARGRVGETN